MEPQKPGRHVMLDNLVAGITDTELRYLIEQIGAKRIKDLMPCEHRHTDRETGLCMTCGAYPGSAR